MKMNAGNYFLKSFEEIGLIEKYFNVYDKEGKLLFANCYINENGYVCTGSNELWSITMGLLTGLYSYEIIPHKKKLRDLTLEEWDKWIEKKCRFTRCENCIFNSASCLESENKYSWIHHKDLYSDKFLDQETEVEE